MSHNILLRKLLKLLLFVFWAGVTMMAHGSPSVYVYPSIADTPNVAGDLFWMDICVGDSLNPVEHLYGVSFVLHYDTAWASIVLPLDSSIVKSHFLGDTNEVLIYHTPEDSVKGDSIGLAVTRLDPDSTVNGWGIILHVRFRTKVETPDTTICFRITSVVASDSVLNPIEITPKNLCIEITPRPIVWPGDTNNDGIVNQKDILPIGVFWSLKGYSRNYPNLIAWEPQMTYPWPQDIRATYANANGDTVIDQNDVLVIGLNWQKRQGIISKCIVNPLENTGEGGSIQAVAFRESSGRYWDISFQVEDVKNLLGISLKFQYPAEEMKCLSVQKADFLKAAPLFFYRDDVSSGTVGIAVSRAVDQGGVSGSGCLVKIRLESKFEMDLFQTRVSSVVGMDVLGNLLLFNVAEELIKENHQLKKFILHQNYPNPFNMSTTVKYDLPEKSHVMIKVYDLLGAEVKTLVEEEKCAGYYEVLWYGKNQYGDAVSSGIYYFKIKAGDFSCVKKGLLLK